MSLDFELELEVPVDLSDRSQETDLLVVHNTCKEADLSVSLAKT